MMLKKFLSLSLIGCLSLSVMTMGANAVNTDESNNSVVSSAINSDISAEISTEWNSNIDANWKNAENTMSAEEPLVEAYNAILNSFPKDSEGKYIYPDDYAGAYIENGKLCIGLTDISANNTEKYCQICDSVEPVFTQKEYSFRELQLINNKILSESDIEYVSSGIYPMENKVRVGVIAADVNKVQQQVSRFIPQTFSHKEELPVEIYETEPLSTMINAYGGLSLGDTTVGIGGRYNGKPAILTCGHGHSVGDILRSNTGEALFKFVKCQYKDQQYYDYGIAEVVSDSVDVLPLVCDESGTHFIKSINQSPVIGMTVEKYGQTTKYTTGIVTGLDVGAALKDSNENKITIYGLIDTGLKTLPGDSGGPVYAESNMYGTVSGGTYTLNTQRMLFSPSAVISNFVLGS